MRIALRMGRVLCCSLGATVLTVSSPARGQDDDVVALEHGVMKHWVAVDNIYVPNVNIAWVSVAVQGDVFTTADAGELEKFARMRVRNDLSQFTHVSVPPDSLFARVRRDLPRIGDVPMTVGKGAAIVLSRHFRWQRFIEVRVMTVGTDYPVAWSVETEYSMHPSLVSENGLHSITKETMGFGAENRLAETVRAAIRSHIEDIASDVYDGAAQWEARFLNSE